MHVLSVVRGCLIGSFMFVWRIVCSFVCCCGCNINLCKIQKNNNNNSHTNNNIQICNNSSNGSKKTHIKPAVALTTNNVWAIFCCCFCSQSVSQPIVARTPLNVRRCRNGLSVGFLVAGSIGRMVNTAAWLMLTVHTLCNGTEASQQQQTKNSSAHTLFLTHSQLWIPAKTLKKPYEQERVWRRTDGRTDLWVDGRMNDYLVRRTYGLTDQPKHSGQKH